MNERDKLLWAGILVPPFLWFVSQCAEFAIAPLSCSSGAKPALHLVILSCILATAVVTVVAARGWCRLRQEPEGEGGPGGRARDMALAAFVLGAGFCLVQSAVSLPNFLLGGCE